MKKALIVVTSHNQLGTTGKSTGWYLPEVTHLYYPLVSAGFEVDFASPKGGAAPLDRNSYNLEDPLNKRFVEDETIARLNQTIAPGDIVSQDYTLLYFAGGHGTMWDFPNSAKLQQVTANIYENGGIVAAVCHGPAALVNVKLTNNKFLVDGKDVSAFTNAEEEAVGLSNVVPFLLETALKERGANFDAGKKWEDKVVVSGRLITGQNPKSTHSMASAIVALANQLA